MFQSPPNDVDCSSFVDQPISIRRCIEIKYSLRACFWMFVVKDLHLEWYTKQHRATGTFIQSVNCCHQTGLKPTGVLILSLAFSNIHHPSYDELEDIILDSS